MTRPSSTLTLAPAGSVEDDDGVLVSAALVDRRAFAPLYRRYVDPVYRYSYRRLGNREAAEDATAAVFAKALAGLPAYRQGSFRAWLFTIAHNTVVDALRARRPTAPAEAALGVVDPGPSPEERAVAAEAGRSLRGVLATLSPDQRRVVELHLMGLTGPEIAGVLGRSHAAVRAVQARAVARLRKVLGAPPHDEDRHGRG